MLICAILRQIGAPPLGTRVPLWQDAE